MTAPKDVLKFDLNLILPKDTYIYIYINNQCTSSTYDTDMFYQSLYVWKDHRSQDGQLSSKHYVYFINSAVLDLTTCTNLNLVMYIPIHKTYLSSI